MSWTATARTGTLAAGLALAGAGLVAAAPAGPVLQTPLAASPLAASSVAVLAGLAVLFFLAELCLLHVEVRREAYSVTLAGIPLVLGLLLCESWELVGARVLGSAAAFAVQRATAVKAGYNLAAYAFEAAVGVLLLHLLLPAGTELSAAMAAVCAVVLLLVDQLMTWLVVLNISWHQGRLSARQSAEVHLPAFLCTALSGAAAYGVLLLSSHGAVGAGVLVVFLGAGGLTYRGFQVLHRRHQALGQVHAFVALNDGDTDLVELSGRMLDQIRALMRAATAELHLTDTVAPLHLAVGENGSVQAVQVHTGGTVRQQRRATDRGLEQFVQDGDAVLLSRSTKSTAARAWLGGQGAKDAVVVPLPGAGGTVLGTLMVLDRLGDTGSFTREDLTLLQTLAGHLAVAVSSARRRDRLRYEATHDVLTGLGNRVLLNQAITRQLDGPDRDRTAVLLLDLDRFKEVNDTLGHHVGDALLVRVAERLRRALPAGATVVRLGGDEFAALLPGVPDLPPEAGSCGATGRSSSPAEVTATQLAQALAEPVELPEATLRTQASIGVALVRPGSTAADLLRHADTAMYAAKDARTGVVVHSDDLDRGRAERLALLADLHLALERGELRIDYQPKLDLAAGRITSVEALVRWQHPRLGPLSPDTFIPLAEANGLIGRLTHVVLTEALPSAPVGRTPAWSSPSPSTCPRAP